MNTQRRDARRAPVRDRLAPAPAAPDHGPTAPRARPVRAPGPAALPPICAGCAVGRGCDAHPGPGMTDLAADGLRGAPTALPHADALRAAFGPHDLGGVTAFVGGPAASAARRMGATAFAAGERIGFAQPPDLRLAAHEAAHVVQQRGGVAAPDARHERHADAVADAVVRGGSALPLLDQVARRDAAPAFSTAALTTVQRFGPRGWGECLTLDDFRTAAADPSLRECWVNFEDLGTYDDRAAFDLLFDFKAEAFYQTLWPQAALVFFLLRPELTLDLCEEALTGPHADDVADLLLVVSSSRFTAAGPAVDTAYRLLDDWLDRTTLPDGSAVRELMRQRQAIHAIDRMQAAVRASWGYDAERPDDAPGQIFFVEQLEELRTLITGARGTELDQLAADVLQSEAVVTWSVDRLNALSRERSSVLEAGEWSPSPDSRFFDQVLLPPWYMVFAAGYDFPAMRDAFDVAEATYQRRRELWVDFRISGFEQTLEGMASAGEFPTTNGSELREPSDQVWQRWSDHKAALAPRVAELRGRHASGAEVDPEEIYRLQRDAYIVVAEYACMQSMLSLFQVWEQLEDVEGQVVGDFDALQADLKRYALRIHEIVTSGGDLVPALDLLNSDEFQGLGRRIETEVSEAQENTRLAMLGIMVLATIASFGAAAVVEAGVLAVVGTTIGATALGALDIGLFLIEVATFTLTFDALSAAAFGHDFDWSSVPGHLVENAIMFGALKWVGGRTLRLFGTENVGVLRALAQFAARHSINLAAFAGVGVGMQLYHTHHLPESWTTFVEDTVAAYLILGTVGFGLGQVRMGIRSRFLVEPRLQQAGARMDRMTALQGEIDAMLAELGAPPSAEPGAEPVVGDGEPAASREPASPERLRDRVAELAREARAAVEDLEVAGAITAEDAAALRDTIDVTTRRLGEARPGFGEGGLPDVAALPGLTTLGDGHTYQYETSSIGALRDALRAYTERGYVTEVDPVSGDLTLLDADGRTVARFTPQLGERVMSTWLLRLRISAEARAGLGRLSPEAFARLRAHHPRVLEALGALAARSPTEAQRWLDSPVLEALRDRPVLAERLVRFANDLADLDYADTHAHVIGALPPGEMLIERLTSATDRRMLDDKYAAVLRIVEGVLERLPEGEERTQKEAEWAELRGDLEALRDALDEDLRARESTAETGREAARIAARLEAILTLPAGGGTGVARDAFFFLYGQVQRGVWRSGREAGVVDRAAGELADRGVAYVELRTGLPADLRAALAQRGLIGPDGEVAPDVRVVVSLTRGADVEPAQQQALFDAIRADPALSRLVVGFDLAGPEASGDLASFRFTADLVLVHNFTELVRVLADRPDVLALARERLGGIEPIDYGQAWLDDVRSSQPDEAAAAFARSELAWVNRALTEAMRDSNAGRAESFPEPSLYGLTAHAGEEVGQTSTGRAPQAGNATLDLLLLSIERSLDSGVDRIGHGLVLGIRLPADLRALGFRYQPSESGVVWVRDLPGGAQERYTSDQIAELEAQRLALIDRVAHLGVTIEVNPSSNIRLSGLDPGEYPMSRLLAERPDLRMSVNTDNPAFHDTDPAMELAILAAAGDVSFARAAMTFLEGYGSRLGGRSLRDADALRTATLDELTRRTPAEQRNELLQALELRYNRGEPTPASSLTAGAFRAALGPYMDVIFQ